MNRIMNNPDYMVEDMLKGFVKAHPDLVSATGNPRVLKSVSATIKDKVGIVTGGGSGHKPAFIGYIGRNMCDAVAVGEIFSSPTAVAFEDAMRAADSGKGVACLYGNYAGDNMNVKMAVRKMKAAGIPVKTVVANDDCASAPRDEREKAPRRGGRGVHVEGGRRESRHGREPGRGDRRGAEGDRQHPLHRHRHSALHHPGGRSPQLRD